MDPDSPRPRLARALILAPLTGPLALWMGSLVYGAITHTARGTAVELLVSALFFAFLFLAFGAPLTYGATLAIVWPLFHLLRARAPVAWWPITLVSCIAGGFLFPAYLHLLEPRGRMDFFPGAGFVAGAVVGVMFWWLASGARSDPSR